MNKNKLKFTLQEVEIGRQKMNNLNVTRNKILIVGIMLLLT